MTYHPVSRGWAGEAPAGAERYRLLVGKGGVQGVGWRVGFLPCNLIDDLEPEPLEREPEAVDDVVRTAHPQRADRLKEVLGYTELPDLHSGSFPKPIERIESLRPNLLHFRMSLGGKGAGELKLVR
jgi:hypothetical protein